MPGALNLTSPGHLLAKLERECQALAANHGDSYAAINALRDAYHLRDWIWDAHLKDDAVLQARVMSSSSIHKNQWEDWVNEQFPDFPIIRDLCNGSKHFGPDPKRKVQVQAAHQAGYDSPLFAFDTGVLGFDTAGFFVQADGGRIVPIAHLVESIRDFCVDLIKQFPQLR